ncbi:hypothetical protein F4553_000432 [Allocatelliglobosispora scoriae]|uniref:DUF4386 family protein n=1 Tax=Allocatelliglobosispora scoriae TaxID=643052 RepID=A0A841BJ28_9ACTN|nr:DUF4386 domain-containing protein [Allocatelliglobosispora scoriae]MBB5867053.1 hypothetical protein [Allocatelliglobosispora scoriae]
MSTTPLSPPRRWPAALFIAEGLLIAVPLVVLGQAVNWPAGLGDPASVTLPLVAAHETGLRAGYLAYLAYSLLFLPVIAVAVGTFAGPAERRHPAARIAVLLAGLSALARAVGILRWLTAMPVLAASWAGADPAMRAVIAVQFGVLNDFGGGIGELLGVAAFGSAAVACATIAIRAAVPAWLTWLGAATAVLAAVPLVELAGVDAGALTSVGVTAVQIWLLALAAVVWRGARR